MLLDHGKVEPSPVQKINNFLVTIKVLNYKRKGVQLILTEHLLYMKSRVTYVIDRRAIFDLRNTGSTTALAWELQDHPCTWL